MTGRGKHTLGTSRCGDPRSRLGNFFSPAHIPHFAYLSFTSMYIPRCQISSSICRLISHWCLIPITFLSLSQLLIFHLLPLWQHLAVLPLCLHSILTSLPVLPSLTTPSLYIYTLLCYSFSCIPCKSQYHPVSLCKSQFIFATDLL